MNIVAIIAAADHTGAATLGRLTGAQSEDLAGLGGGGDLAVELAAGVGDFLDQLRVAGGEAAGLDAQVVLQAGAAMAAGLEAPLVHLPLVAADAGGDPGGAGQDLLDL